MNKDKTEDMLYDGFHKIRKVVATIKGKEVIREQLVIKPGVAALIIDENDRIALVKQYRPVPNITSYELPAGILDKPHLTEIETLLEELQEECELSLDDIISYNEQPIDEYYMVVGSSDSKLKIFEIRVKAQKELVKLVDDVDVDCVMWCTFEEVGELIKNKSIQDSKTKNAFNYLKIKKLEKELSQYKK